MSLFDECVYLYNMSKLIYQTCMYIIYNYQHTLHNYNYKKKHLFFPFDIYMRYIFLIPIFVFNFTIIYIVNILIWCLHVIRIKCIKMSPSIYILIFSNFQLLVSISNKFLFLQKLPSLVLCLVIVSM